MKSSGKWKNFESEWVMQKRPAIVALTAVTLLTLAVVFFFFDPAQGGFYPSCMFHRLTGLNCPGCGALRALHHLVHGDFGEAFHCNPLLMVLLPFGAFSGLRWLQRGRGALENDSFLRPITAYTLLAVTIAFTVLRNLPGPTFAWMSP
jgi:hypothetical protein